MQVDFGDSVKLGTRFGKLGLLIKTQGEIESAIAEGMGRFEQEYIGRGRKDDRAHLMGDLVVIRLRGVLTVAEQHLAKTLENGNG